MWFYTQNTERAEGGEVHHIPIATNFTQTPCQSRKACWNVARSFTTHGALHASEVSAQRCD